MNLWITDRVLPVGGLPLTSLLYVIAAGGVPLSASSGWGWPSWRAPWCLRLERRWVVNALRGSWLRPLAVPWMWTLEWRLLWMIFLWPLLLRQGRGASTALFQVALAQIRLGPLVGRARALCVPTWVPTLAAPFLAKCLQAGCRHVVVSDVGCAA